MIRVYKAFGEHPVNGQMVEWCSSEKKALKALEALQQIGCSEPMGVVEDGISNVEGSAKAVASFLNSVGAK